MRLPSMSPGPNGGRFGRAQRGLMLEAAHHDGGQQRHRLAVGPRFQKRADRKLARVELALAHHRLEALVRDLRPAEIEIDQIGFDRAALDRLGDRVVREVGAQRDRAGFRICGHRRLSSSPPRRAPCRDGRSCASARTSGSDSLPSGCARSCRPPHADGRRRHCASCRSRPRGPSARAIPDARTGAGSRAPGRDRLRRSESRRCPSPPSASRRDCRRRACPRSAEYTKISPFGSSGHTSALL